MKYIFIILAALIMVNCERDKESLPGSYKLEKPKENEQEKVTYSSSFDAGSLRKTEAIYKINSYSQLQSTSLGAFKELAVSLKTMKKDEKTFFELTIVDKNNNGDSSLKRNIPLAKDSPTLFNFIYEDVRYYGAIICKEPDCKAIRFSFVADKLIEKDENHSLFYVTFLGASAEADIFTFKKICYNKNSLSYQTLVDDPYYVLNLPDGSEELTCYEPQ